jgi:predicted ArsR family transcriptional regulator
MRRVLRGAGVGGVAFAVLTALCMYADEAGNVRASADDIAYTAGVKLDTARRHLRALRQDGAIELRERSAGRRPNLYHLLGADETPPDEGGAA